VRAVVFTCSELGRLSGVELHDVGPRPDALTRDRCRSLVDRFDSGEPFELCPDVLQVTFRSKAGRRSSTPSSSAPQLGRGPGVLSQAPTAAAARRAPGAQLARGGNLERVRDDAGRGAAGCLSESRAPRCPTWRTAGPGTCDYAQNRGRFYGTRCGCHARQTLSRLSLSGFPCVTAQPAMVAARSGHSVSYQSGPGIIVRGRVR
jgi:hypothetical protein